VTDLRKQRAKKNKYKTVPDSVTAEIFKNAPVMWHPGDLAGPLSATDDHEGEDFVTWFRAQRQRNLI